jgi:hypothetical protein
MMPTTNDAKLNVATSSPSLFGDSNLFQNKMIKNKEEALFLECFVITFKVGKMSTQLSLLSIQAAPTLFGGNESKGVTKAKKKTTSKPVTCNLQVYAKTKAKVVSEK